MITRPIRYLIILFLSSSLLFFLDSINAFDFGSNLANRFLIGPVARSGSSAVGSGVSLFESFFSFRSFLEENEKLEEERDHYRGEYFKLRSVEEENKFLRGALDLESSSQSSLVLADVTIFDPLRSGQIITINKGSSSGIKIGDPVILAGRILVGTVEEVLNDTSRVLLITSESSSVVTRLERSGTNAVISGSASGALILDLVLPETDLLEGEIIVSSGIEGDIPPNLLVGQVSKIISEETASFKKAVVRSFFNFRDLSQIFIITS